MASAEASQALDTLAAWREQGAQRLDPVRFRFIEALARRAAAQQGRARERLDARLAEVMQAYGQAWCGQGGEQAGAGPAEPGDGQGDAGSDSDTSAHGEAASLAALSGLLASRWQARNGAAGQEGRGGLLAARPGEMAVLAYFRDLWAQLSIDRGMRETLSKVPENTGPLNSLHLVHRSLTLMHDVSPDYARALLSYIDALARIEQIGQTRQARPAAARGAETARKPLRGK
ncbi:hypothetical protein PIGHUM_01690 [Pigmentiphaga humi]|uniref:DUF2894 domain-containing protein n=1 Tax=Pigmentiphaga humi TaxID=2478468 RepID=A0A3P4AZY6_9BURK|nr:DUF2894 domain-containing protein [Pigmentiphaga humi]VCU69627.1 hypothetical protein PIGHUM_01690 [Pigmentiphaga humi]